MNRNRQGRKWFTVLAAFLPAFLLTCIVMSVNVFAEGTITIAADPQTGAVGDTITVTYQAEGTSDDGTPPQFSITYDPNRLEFLDCDKEYGGGGGGLLQFTDNTATITFSVLSGGVAQITADATFDGDGADVASAYTEVVIDGEDTAAAMSAAAASETGVEPGTIVSTDGSKIVSTVFDSSFMPPSFSKTTTTYAGQTVECAKMDTGSITLLYVTDNTGGNGAFNIYDEATGELSDCKMIYGIENQYIIILKAPESVQVPNGFTKAALQWDGMTLEAYAVNEIDSSVITDVMPTDFFLLYAANSQGETGWYLYDQVGGTYQRYLPIANGSQQTEEEGGFLAALTGSGEDGDYQAVAFRRLIIIGVMAVVMIVMFIFLLNFFLKLRDYQSYDYIDEEEEEMKTARRDPSVEETSRIRASELARMEMGETFEPVNFDKLVNDPQSAAKGTTPGAPVVKSVTTPEAAAAKLGANPAPVSPAPVGPAPAKAPAGPAPAGQIPAQPQPQSGINAHTVSDVVKPKAEADDGFEDDYEDEGGFFSRKSKEEKKKEKKKKKGLGFDQPDEIDWSSLEGTIKDTNDDRRPKGGESPYSKMGTQNAPSAPAAKAPAAQAPAAPAPAGVAPAQAAKPAQANAAKPEAPAAAPAQSPAGGTVPTVDAAKVSVDIPKEIPKPDTNKAVKPASQIHKETVPQQESNYWQQSTTQSYTDTSPLPDAGATQPASKYSYDENGQYVQNYDPYSQPYNQGYDQSAAYGYGQGYDAYGQGYNQGYDPSAAYGYGQGYAQGYDQYGQPYDPNAAYYGQGYGQGYPQYGQPQNLDLDDDFEFEFIDINR